VRRCRQDVPPEYLQTLSRLLEEPSLATTLQGVYFIYFAATCFGLCYPSSGGIHNKNIIKLLVDF
jgi:hypothetical protein